MAKKGNGAGVEKKTRDTPVKKYGTASDDEQTLCQSIQSA